MRWRALLRSPVLAVLCAVAIALAGGALARAGGLHAVTICAGDGMRVVLLDGEHSPSALLPCPDCVPAQTAALPPPPGLPARRARLRRGHRSGRRSRVGSRPLLQQRARAPPPVG